MNLIKIISEFKTQEDCINYLETKRWSGVPKCPYCGSTNTNKLASEGRHRHHCNGCRKSFCVTIGTIYHGSHIELQKWFLLIALMMNAKKSLSACQAARDLGMRRPTVWSMMHRIRKALTQDTDLLCGIVEVDETYTCTKKDDDDDDLPKMRGRGCNKQAIVGMVERNGKVKAKKQDKLNFEALKKLIFSSIDIKNSVLLTDEYRGYAPFKKHLPHYTVNHSIKEYAVDGVSTNAMEGFWSQLKRSIHGTYHSLSAKHLQNYVNEFVFRYNHRMSTTHIFTSLMEKVALPFQAEAQKS